MKVSEGSVIVTGATRGIGRAVVDAVLDSGGRVIAIARDAAALARLVAEHDDWTAWVPLAPTFPVALEIAPKQQIPDLPLMDDENRDGMSSILIDVLARLDQLYDDPLPYMLWLNQRPTVQKGYDDHWFNVEIVSPFRSAGVQRFIAGAEVASEEYFNPVVPEDLAERLRQLG